MPTQTDELRSILLDIRAKVDVLLSDITVRPNQIQTHEGLSDITSSLGTIRAGEFRVGKGTPGQGFQGMRMAYPPMSYDGTDWHLVGVDSDDMQFGVNALDGTLVAGAGGVKLYRGGLLATLGSIAGWEINSTEIKKNGIILDSDGDVIYVGSGVPRIVIDGGNKNVRSSNFATGASGFKLDGATGNIEAQNIVARGEIRTSIFSVGEMTGTAGTTGVFKAAGKLKSDVTSVSFPQDTIIDIDDPATGHSAIFVVDDIIRIKAIALDNWFKVYTVTDMTTYYRYTCKLMSGTPGTANAGVAVIDYGQAGDGFLIMTADATNAPYYSVQTHAGSPWSDARELIRIGNLNGFLGYASDIYGIGIGDSDTYMTFDSDNGLIVRGASITESPHLHMGWNVQDEEPIGTRDGQNVEFLLQSNPIYGTVCLRKNGLALFPGVDYSTYSSNEFSFNTLYLTTDDVIEARYVDNSTLLSVNEVITSGSFTSTTVFTTGSAIKPGTLSISVNGIVLNNGVDYFAGNRTILLDQNITPLDTDDVLTVSYQTVSADTTWDYNIDLTAYITYPPTTDQPLTVNFSSSTINTDNNAEIEVFFNGQRISSSDFTFGESIIILSGYVGLSPTSDDLLWANYKGF